VAWIGVIGTILGTLVGGVLTYVATARQDSRRRAQELADLKASIYSEIADRAARCVNDYLDPWRDNVRLNKLSPEWVGKFRPTDPVVLPGVAGKLGLLDGETLLAVTQFYFRLDVLTKALESLCASLERRGSVKGLAHEADKARVEAIARRLESCFNPALRALQNLNVGPAAANFDDAATRVYPHLRKSGLTLRQALKEHFPTEKA